MRAQLGSRLALQLEAKLAALSGDLVGFDPETVQRI